MGAFLVGRGAGVESFVDALTSQNLTKASMSAILKDIGSAARKNFLVDRYFGQQRKFWSDEPIHFNGNKVYQRNDLIDPNRVDVATGLTNKQLMQQGYAPYGPDGKKINLHHMIQTQSGPIAEVSQTFHQQNNAAIHVNTPDIPSGINRVQFDAWRRDYWINRANDF